MLDRKLNDDMLSLANAALGQRAGDAEELYTEIILKLKQSLSNNQKEMAAALQALARQIESEGREGDAFAFKQRTCAVMLQLSMAERHAGRQLPPSPAAALQTPQPEAIAGPAAAPKRAIRSPFRALYFTCE